MFQTDDRGFNRIYGILPGAIRVSVGVGDEDVSGSMRLGRACTDDFLSDCR